MHSTITDLAGKDYAEWFLGHAKSSYYTKKEPERREIYATKCMKYLTFLDYTLLEARGRSTETSLQEKDREIQALKAQMTQTEQQIVNLHVMLESYKSDVREHMESEFEVLRQKYRQDMSDEMKRTGKDMKTLAEESVANTKLVPIDLVESFRELKPSIFKDMAIHDLRAKRHEIAEILQIDLEEFDRRRYKNRSNIEPQLASAKKSNAKDLDTLT